MKNTSARDVEINELAFRWPGQPQNTLDIDQLNIESGERIFLHGPSGCGKSTLLSLLAGVISSESGEINILGNQFHSMTGAHRDRFRADHIGIIFQQFNLIPYLSVVENVLLPCQFSNLRKNKAIKHSGNEMDEALRLLDYLGLAGSDILNKSVTRLSVGQQQRVAAARSMIGSPEILIADEPTSSMDADLQSAFIELLFKECERVKTTLVFVSHDRNLSSPFDRTIKLPDINRMSGSDAFSNQGSGEVSV